MHLNGRYVAGPVFDQETILHACLDLTEIERECMTLDVSGHYSRPDLFRFSVAEQRENEDVSSLLRGAIKDGDSEKLIRFVRRTLAMATARKMLAGKRSTNPGSKP